MKFNDYPRIELLYNGTNVVLPISNEDRQKAIELVEGIDLEKDYTIEIKPKKEKRTLDQNAYMWKLIGELASKIGRSNKDVYKSYIADYGIGEIVPIKEEAIKRWCEVWESKGIGWITEDLGECRHTKGYHNIKSYYGSSTYTTEEMGRIIDAIIFDCKEQGIPTETPDELEKLKELWQKNQ